MISVVVPFYNEEDNIEPLHAQLSDVLKSLNREHKIIFVDDGSTDNTFKNMLKAREKDTNVRIIKFRKNFGQTAALKAGFDHAEGNITISMDGDLQNDPADIPKLIEKIGKEDYDVVCGWRADRKDTFSKKITSKFANMLRKLTTNSKIHDSGCTFRAYRNGCVKNLDLYGETHRYIPAMLSWKGYRIGEVKVKHHPRKYGKTKYGLLRLGKGFLDLIVISFWQKFSARPIHVFGGLGLLLGISGVLLGGYMGIERLFFGKGLSDRPLFLLAVLMVIIGVQFVVSGILADIMLKVYYGQNERKNYLIERVVE
ncbi:MAG: glycosyltransferase group 2 family protein [Candidatus Methanoperedens nitroreducens]|uniref:Glycosyltransferase group 2 family protein n=1 Tax=Candidatus Methanoperedens nitratireducens TaxID=1392998 RepID=A0A0P7ZH59_9EURY|nr:glycosyltransferase family 2 protein [Candidatus Methanoperedens sp. BLZ2]KAB2945342.1 MAG: glycosyltransferase family 2 protein [Candidatus Methanoperedens sp.]KPQ43032.1 MAG: glycosyltransferase group 2 family protein [Candidatus Methanoperedens sp. BLZ1]MBZ0176549.1 glycosyltransferase family 2 protein [Candidatus Methanoperedens nitroreducens]CAG0950922.1 dolichol-phosphate mannosyltransferase [Methanosarcinales archaeon]MCX9077867.1 glycosyltransferase family 2 protein [Candidatus Meth